MPRLKRLSPHGTYKVDVTMADRNALERARFLLATSPSHPASRDERCDLAASLRSLRDRYDTARALDAPTV